MHAAVEGRGQAGLQLAAAARRQPLGAEAERALQLVHPPQLRRLVAVERDVQGAVAAVAGGDPARLLQLGDEVRVELRRGQGHLQQLRLAEGELADRGQHPGGDPRRPGRGPRALDHRDPGAALRRAPGAGEADDAASDDYRVVTLGCSLKLCLRRHYPDQVQTVGGLDAALSALVGLPLLLRWYPSRVTSQAQP